MSPSPVPDLRLATLAEIDELVRLRRMMMADLGELTEDGSWEPACADFLRETLADGSTGAVVAGPPGALVACGVGTTCRRLPGPKTPTGRYGYIASMVTEPAWRGRGLASRIVVELLAWFGEQGVSKVDLHASVAGEPIYRALGFTEGQFPELRWRAPVSG